VTASHALPCGRCGSVVGLHHIQRVVGSISCSSVTEWSFASTGCCFAFIARKILVLTLRPVTESYAFLSRAVTMYFGLAYLHRPAMDIVRPRRTFSHKRPLCIISSMYGVSIVWGGGVQVLKVVVKFGLMLRYETSVTTFPSQYGHKHDSRTFMPLILVVLRMRPRHTAPWGLTAAWDFWAPTVS